MKHTFAPTEPTVISWFDDFGGHNPYAYLSNFYIGEPIMWRGASYPTGEHLFAALKAATTSDHETIRNAPGPAAAKTTGRSIDLRPDWELVKYDAMVLVLALKFTLERAEGQWLLGTGDALLVEGTHWGDTVWGVDLSDWADLPWQRFGRNWLGRLLMARRAELRAEAAYGVAAGLNAVSLFALHGKPMKPAKPQGPPEGWFEIEPLTDPVNDAYGDDDNLIEYMGAFKTATRTPFCREHDGVCETPWHVHAPAGPLMVGGRLSHANCDHVDSRNARDRCRRRFHRALRAAGLEGGK
jgi:ribA/ribD-fused uncharacterized protein